MLILKAACLAIYGLALAGWAGFLTSGLSAVVPLIAVVFLAVHALELVFAFKYVRRYHRSLTASMLLTMLFGVLHWVPLVKQSKKA